MKKLKIMQFSFLFTAVITTVLFLCVPFDIIPVLYVFLYCTFVLIPLAVATVFQLFIVKKNLAEHIQAVRTCKDVQYAKEKKHIRFPEILLGLYTIAKIKSMGINPNRAGPFKTFALE